MATKGAEAATVTHPARRPVKRNRVLVPALCFVVMTTAVIQTAVVPLLPAMASQLGVDSAAVGWVVTANLLAAAVCTPVLGRLADRRGPRPVLLGTLVLVLLGSVLCTVTDHLPFLVLGRILQGVSFALFPIGVAVLRGRLDPRRLLNAIGLMSGILAVGGGVGMVAAGVMHTEGADFRRVFALLVALNLAALVVAWVTVPRGGAAQSRDGVDVAGVGLMAVGLSALLIALAEGGRWGWASPQTIGVAAVGVVVSAGWYLHERRTRAPLVPPPLLSGRRVAGTHLAAFLVGMAMYIQFLGSAQFVQASRAAVGYGFDASVLRTSLVVLLPGSVVGVVAASASGRFVHRYRADRVLIAACGIGVAGFVMLALAHTRLWQVIVALVVINVFVSASCAVLPALLVDTVPSEFTGVTNGINAIARTFGSSLASALVATLLASVTVAGTDLASERAFVIAFWVGGAAAGAAGLVIACAEHFWRSSADRGIRFGTVSVNL
ncbi:MFS transporter [Rhodococcus sp. NPDC059968]|uniref:MFS transporter n=1 Tax=Rhodococcus sp. NPDC059968 TaxID=3347017 RepID=UPI003670BCF4